MRLPRAPAIDAWVVDSTVKGYPGDAPPMPLGEIRARGWNVLRDGLPLPVAVLKASSLQHNRAWMRRYLESAGAVLCPHGKTTMSPQLFAAQLEDGAFGITCASIAQLQVYRRHGIRRVLMANQLVSERALAFAMGELARDAEFELYLLVDSVAGVERLAAAARAASLPSAVRVLLEVGADGARTGVRTMAEFEVLLGAVEAAGARLRVHGVECYEGVVEPAGTTREAAIEALFGFQLAASARARRSHSAATPWLLSAGGSAYFDVAARRLRAGIGGDDGLLVLRSGCYLSHDHGAYQHAQRSREGRDPALAAFGEGLRPAFEVWTHVQSRPEPTRAHLTAGKRDVPSDLDLPKPIAWFRPTMHGAPQPLRDGHCIVKLNDQHAHLAVPADSPLAVGDLVALGISHPCTAFDRWQLLYVVVDDYAVVDAIRTFF